MEQEDRRKRKTQQALIEALLGLLAEKTYDQISVNDIVGRADVGRSTFYAHYQDKDDLLRSGFEQVLELLADQVRVSSQERSVQIDATAMFAHAQGHYDLYKVLVWGTGMDVLTRDGHAGLSAKLQESLAPLVAQGGEPAVPLEIVANSLAGTSLLLLKWWLDHKMPYTPEQMNAYLQVLVVPSLREIFG